MLSLKVLGLVLTLTAELWFETKLGNEYGKFEYWPVSRKPRL